MLRATRRKLAPALLVGSMLAGTACASVANDPPAMREQEQVPQAQAGEQVVEVSLENHDITLRPEVLEPGTVVFRVRNNAGGTVVAGVNHDWLLEPTDESDWEKEIRFTLDPGNQEDFEVQLEPGTYTIYCTVGDHSKTGELATLAVGDVSGERADEQAIRDGGSSDR